VRAPRRRGKHAHEATHEDERARRIATDHRVWVAVASFAGATGGGCAPAAGGPGIWSPAGVPVVRAGTAPAATVTATLGRVDARATLVSDDGAAGSGPAYEHHRKAAT
jgi:hypothetical protein